MGILKAKTEEKASSTKRRSLQTDFAKLPPLKPGGAVGFLNYREGQNQSPKGRRKSTTGNHSDMDSDEDEEQDVAEADKADEEENNGTAHLSPDDIRRQGDLAEGVRKIKVRSMSP